ncbi:hypothetical protein [Pseudomonas simiae]|uniref:hypothetical protein n=1 Tax=Pseudomonas simiae TaxID=321846 RepID=UPI00331632A2
MPNDAGDLNKSRGFLLTYSVVVLSLWYFGAELTAFKLMGTEIQLKHRTESVWLVLACLNMYFLIRLFQHIPNGGFRFNDPMRDLYDHSLRRLAVWRNHFKLRKMVREVKAEKHLNEKVKFVSGSAHMTWQDRLRDDRRNNPDEDHELHHYNRMVRTEMKVSAYYRYTIDGKWITFGDYVRLGTYTPSWVLTWAVKSYVTVKGALLTPWFTNNIFPLVLGLISTGVACWTWWHDSSTITAACVI